MTIGAELLASTFELVDIASVSRDEAAIADRVEAELRGVSGLAVSRIADNVVARTAQRSPNRILLGGHLDTVPPKGNGGARLEGETISGVGSADMKGGLAVLLALVADQRPEGPDLTVVFYAKEEIARRHSGLLEIEEHSPDLLECEVAVLLEPTANVVEAGCQGVLRASLHLGGIAAHSARPWTGRNAIHRLAPVLSRIDSVVERRPVIDGCEYRESLQAVRIEGGGAGNVVPDEVTVTLSHRFAPDRDAEAAFAWLSDELSGLFDRELGDRLELEESAPAALPHLDHPALRALVEQSGSAPRAKLAWTDVAYFAAKGVPAANFGPGDPLVAHTAHERIDADALEANYRALAGLLGHPW